MADAGAATDVGAPADAGPPYGAACTSSDECGTAECSVLSLIGGQCGECIADDQCPAGGCSLQNPYDDTAGSVCNMGAAGDGCESRDVCQADQECGRVFSLLGLVEVTSCGECASDADCTLAAAPRCTPVFNTETFSGQSFCLAPNSLDLNRYCDFQGDGNIHCASNRCNPVDANGLAEAGACGACDDQTNDGCDVGETCVAGSYDLIGTGAIVGSTCQ